MKERKQGRKGGKEGGKEGKRERERYWQIVPGKNFQKGENALC